jgi:uncharacterized membrane protein
LEWTGAQLVNGAHALGSVGRSLHHIEETIHSPAPAVRRIGVADLKDAIVKGFEDFEAYRSDVIFVGIVYAVAGLVLARLAFGLDMLPLIFPLVSGFALIGPIAGLALYEMSRLKEQGRPVAWENAADVMRAPAIGAIAVLGLMLFAIFLVWLGVAWLIYQATLGPAMPSSIASFVHDVLLTPRGQAMIVIGIAVGFLFALFTLTISIVSFPLLLDRDVGLDTAVRTSVRAVMLNPVPMALWGLIVAGGLVLGSLPLFLGLIVVLPVLGHATWHLYRKVVV